MKDYSGFFSDLDEPSNKENSYEGFFSDMDKEDRSKNISNFRSGAGAFLKGVGKTAQHINPFQPRGPIPPELGERLLEENLPSKQKHSYLERAGKIAPYAITPGTTIPAAIAEIAAGTAAGELAEKSGFGDLGQTISEGLSMGLPGAVKALGKRASASVNKIAQKLPSGLTKLKALDAKRPNLGSLSTERQQKVLKDLTEESAKLAKTSVHKHVPLSKAIEEGVNFDKNFEIGFSNLKKSAEKANPDIDITPISNLFKETADKYRGIPKLHSEGVKVVQELKAFSNNPQTSLKNLLKVYRSNNRKIKNIYETSRITGGQKEYVDFLLDMNKSISKSFEETLPKESAWMNEFKDLNSTYKAFHDAQKTLSSLKGILSERPKLSELDKLVNDKKTQNKLALSMGKEGSEEIIQIAKDLKVSRDVLKSIPKGTFQKFDALFPLYTIIPFIGKLIGINKALNVGRYSYGWYLSTPARRAAYHDAVKAFVNRDLNAYKKATNLLKDEMKKYLDEEVEK